MAQIKRSLFSRGFTLYFINTLLLFNFSKFKLKVCIKIINYFKKARSEWNFHKWFMGSLDNCCPSLSTKYETWNTSRCYKNQHWELKWPISLHQKHLIFKMSFCLSSSLSADFSLLLSLQPRLYKLTHWNRILLLQNWFPSGIENAPAFISKWPSSLLL